MTITTLGRMDAYCTACTRDVVVRADLRCPYCGTQVDRRSLPQPPSAMESPRPQVVEGSAVTVEPRRAETVSLPKTRATLRWISSTEALLRVYEKEAADARADYDRVVARAQAEVEAAKARVTAARTNVRAMRAVLGAVQVDGQAQAALPAPGGRWHHYYTACRDCGTQDQARPHARWGRCGPCLVTYREQKRTGGAS